MKEHSEQFLSHVAKNGQAPTHRPSLGQCWVWQRSLDSHGYGRMMISGRRWLAHRLAYEIFIGPPPIGTELDHLCRNTRCVNPTHLEPVTHAENMRRGNVVESAKAWARAITHCPDGHPYSGDNLKFRPNGARRCRECSRIFSKEYRQRKKLKAG
jgi:hypothetical protein